MWCVAQHYVSSVSQARGGTPNNTQHHAAAPLHRWGLGVTWRLVCVRSDTHVSGWRPGPDSCCGVYHVTVYIPERVEEAEPTPSTHGNFTFVRRGEWGAEGRTALSPSRPCRRGLWLRKMFNLFNKSAEANRDKRKITFNYY